MSRDIQILDCTLRDGGHVNDFLFGRTNISSITEKLAMAGIDIIEIGFLKDVEFDQDKTLYDSLSRLQGLLPALKEHQCYSLMIRPDRFNIDALQEFESVGLLRFAFYEEDFELAMSQANSAREAGYKVFLNPVNVMGYSAMALENLLREINIFSPLGVSIVDTFGAMEIADLERLYPVFESNLNPDIRLGLHLHENLSLAYGLAQHFFRLASPERGLVIDASLNGMGRIPGNLCTELIAEHLNQNNCRYDMNQIYSAIQEQILPFKDQYEWGYCPAFAISARLGIHRSYPEYLKYRRNAPLTVIADLCDALATHPMALRFSESVVEEILAKHEY